MVRGGHVEAARHGGRAAILNGADLRSEVGDSRGWSTLDVYHQSEYHQWETLTTRSADWSLGDRVKLALLLMLDVLAMLRSGSAIQSERMNRESSSIRIIVSTPVTR